MVKTEVSLGEFTKNILETIFHAHDSVWRRTQFISGITLATFLLMGNILISKYDELPMMILSGVTIILFTSFLATTWILVSFFTKSKKIKNMPNQKSVFNLSAFPGKKGREEYIERLKMVISKNENLIKDLGENSHYFFYSNVKPRLISVKHAFKIFIFGLIVGTMLILAGIFL